MVYVVYKFGWRQSLFLFDLQTTVDDGGQGGENPEAPSPCLLCKTGDAMEDVKAETARYLKLKHQANSE